MAANKAVVLPDGETLQFPSDMSVEQIRAALIAVGKTSVNGATYSVSSDGATVTFQAPQGGRKG